MLPNDTAKRRIAVRCMRYASVAQCRIVCASNAAKTFPQLVVVQSNPKNVGLSLLATCIASASLPPASPPRTPTPCLGRTFHSSPKHDVGPRRWGWRPPPPHRHAHGARRDTWPSPVHAKTKKVRHPAFAVMADRSRPEGEENNERRTRNLSACRAWPSLARGTSVSRSPMGAVRQEPPRGSPSSSKRMS